MSRSFPIWYNITNCNYATKKDFGFKDTGIISVKIGSGRKNSHEFFKTKITRRTEWIEIDGETKEVMIFKYSVDDIIIKKAMFELSGERAGKLITIENCL